MNRFTFEALFFDLAEPDDFVLCLSLEPGEHHLLRFDIAFAFAEFSLVGVELFLRDVVLVKDVAPRIGQHVDENLGLNLILRCLNTGQEWNARCTAAHESRNGHGLDVAPQEIDGGTQPLTFQLESDHIVFKNFKVGLGLEIGIRGCIGLLPGCLDLSGRALGVGLVGAHRGRDRENGREANNDQADASSQTSSNRPDNDPPTLRSSGAGDPHTMLKCS